MLAPVLIAALLASDRGPDAAALRHELDAVAGRIEALKARRLVGEDVEGELEPLLVRSQELAAELNRLRPEAGPPAAAASPPEAAPERADELAERASILRDEADRLLHACAALDARILAALRAATAVPPDAAGGGEAHLAPAWAPATASGAPVSAARPRSLATAIAPLVDERLRLELRARVLEAQASELERDAQELERGAPPGAPQAVPAEPAPPAR